MAKAKKRRKKGKENRRKTGPGIIKHMYQEELARQIGLIVLATERRLKTKLGSARDHALMVYKSARKRRHGQKGPLERLAKTIWRDALQRSVADTTE